MTADEFLTLEGRPTVRVSRAFPHSIERVWRAVTRGEYLAAWFPSPVESTCAPVAGCGSRRSTATTRQAPSWTSSSRIG